MEWERNKLISAILIGTFIGLAIVFMQRNESKYTINNYNFICNNNICQIEHINIKNQIVLKKNIDISNIEKFEARLSSFAKGPKTIGPNFWDSGKVYYIYAVAKKGRDFKLSPLYFPNRNYYDKQHVLKVVEDLNNALNTEPLDIRYSYR